MDCYHLPAVDILNVRAVLFPVSDAYRYSLKRTGQKKATTTITRAAAPPSLPSPDVSGDESSVKKGRRDTQSYRASQQASEAIVLRQTKSTYRFTIGSAHDSFLKLTVNPDSSARVCYINLSHCQIYPDPNKSSLWLYNTSTSNVSALTLSESGDTVIIDPGQHGEIKTGIWNLSLGVGLDFVLRVLPFIQDGSASSTAVLAQETADPKIDRKAKPKSLEDEKLVGKDRNPLYANTSPESPSQFPSHHQQKVQSQKLSHITSTTSKQDVIAETAVTRVLKREWKGKVVIVKTCRSPNIKWAADMWANEFDILKELKTHPSITKLLDYDAKNLTLLLEYHPGVDLAKYANKEGLSQLPEQAHASIWVDISSALDHLHMSGIAHQDVKPENIIFMPENCRSVLVDYGVASRVCNARAIGGGTPCYIPPEFLEGRRAESSDVWAFGIVMLFVSGKIPLPSEGWPVNQVLRKDSAARRKMEQWLSRIERVRKSLEAPLELISEMLKHDTDRIKAPDLVKRLKQRQVLTLAA